METTVQNGGCLHIIHLNFGNGQLDLVVVKSELEKHWTSPYLC